MRRAYIARYPLATCGNDLDEEIIARDTYWSPALSAQFDALARARQPGAPMLQGWYVDAEQVACMAFTDQPFRLN